MATENSALETVSAASLQTTALEAGPKRQANDALPTNGLPSASDLPMGIPTAALTYAPILHRSGEAMR